MKLYCDVCNMNKEFEVKSEPYKVKVKGVEIDTVIKASYCKTCGNEIYNRELEIENDVIVFDEYKKTWWVIKNRKEKKEMFKIGDIVRIVNCGRDAGLVGKIIKNHRDLYILDIITNDLGFYELELELVEKENNKFDESLEKLVAILNDFLVHLRNI